MFPAASPEAHAGGTVTVAIPPPRSIDPAAVSAFDYGGSLVVRTMCDSLIAFDPVTGKPKPAIAASWQVVDGGARVSVKLRDGVRFSDSTPLNADDVAAALTRAALPETASPAASLLSEVKGYEALRGETEDVTAKTRLDGVDVADRTSLDITLTERNAEFYRTLGSPIAAPTPRKIASTGAFAEKPVCAGPYRLARAWRPGDRQIVLERWSGYYAANPAFTRGGRGFADRIVFEIADTASDRLAMLERGNVDAAHVDSTLLRRAPGAGEVVVSSAPSIDYVGLPTTTAPFDRRAVRVALSQAVDRKAIAAAVYGDTRLPARGYLPFAHGDDLHDAGGCGRNAPETGDVAAARRTLASAGVSLRGKNLRMVVDDGIANRRLARAVADQWHAAFDVTTVVDEVAYERYRTMARQPGFTSPFRASWAAEVPSADAFLDPLFSSDSIGRDNLTHFSSRDFDDVLDRDARRTTDTRDELRAYRDLEDIVCDQMPAIPVTYGAAVDVLSKRLGAARGSGADRTTAQLSVRELYLR